jgi:hypothetical protein
MDQQITLCLIDTITCKNLCKSRNSHRLKKSMSVTEDVPQRWHISGFRYAICYECMKVYPYYKITGRIL